MVLISLVVRIINVAFISAAISDPKARKGALTGDNVCFAAVSTLSLKVVDVSFE